MGDVLARGGLAQSGMDGTGNALVTHHNTEQLLRDIEAANRWAELAPNTPQFAPAELKQRLHDIGGFLRRYDPEKTITGHLRGFVDELEEDRVDDS